MPKSRVLEKLAVVGARDWLLPGLPYEAIAERYRQGAGNELASGKIASRESSAALVANAFGYFMMMPEALPRLPGMAGSWAPESIQIEEQVRFPWSGGEHPWLDVMVETKTHMVGIESKRFEPFRGGASGTFSDAYSRKVWGTKMGSYEWLRDGLKQRSDLFKHVDAAQLIKHAFALRTQATKRGKIAALLYLYSEPPMWPDGRVITDGARNLHAEEARMFFRLVNGAEVRFMHCTYDDLLRSFEGSNSGALREHARAVRERFGC